MGRRAHTPCGKCYCPAPIRLLWGVPDIQQTQIAAISGIGLAEVARRAERLGVADQRPKRRTPVYSPREFRRLWLDESVLVRQIGQRFGMTAVAVRVHARKLGLPPRVGGRRPTVNWPADFADMWRLGVGTPEMAAFIGCFPTAVTRKAKEMGLGPRKASRWHKITLADFRAHQLREAMAKSARESDRALALAQMKDGDLRRWAA